MSTALKISEEAIRAYEYAIYVTNRVLKRCNTLGWHEISAMKDENPSIHKLAQAVAWCADIVELAADKGLLTNGGMLDEARECEFLLRQIERAIAKNDEKMLKEVLRK